MGSIFGLVSTPAAQVVVNDAAIKVFSGVMLEPWVEGEAWLRPALNCLAWDDPALVEAVRELVAPPSTLPYNFSVPMDQMAVTDLQGEMGQPRWNTIHTMHHEL